MATNKTIKHRRLHTAQRLISPVNAPDFTHFHRRQTLSGLLFISPWIVGFLIFTAWPMIYSAYLTVTDYDVINAPRYVGAANFQQLIEDPKTTIALGNTIFYTVLQVPAHVLVALGLALLLNHAGRLSGFFRTIFYLPNMTPPVATGILFLLLFNGHNGLLNKVLLRFGIHGPAWTTDPNWQKPGLILMSLWTVGASVIILLAALRGVPQDLYESARIDGAGWWRRTWHVTLPLVSPSLLFVVVSGTIGALQNFDVTYTAFFGAGSNSSYTNDAVLFYVIYLFRQAFEYLHFGYASALAWMLFLVILAITGIQLAISRRVVYYEGRS
ncbi:carbohydrate ABC transporter permease [Bifidobacterium aquikefiri]|uniref:carbohydrate ABC transporter permease n=1 Tax=Bifidobacterium aquikefiri TaxID=1653207 RepID=UPI0039EB594F